MCWFSIGNGWLAVRAELSKCKCYWVQALWAGSCVAYSSICISNLGLVVANHVLCSVNWLPGCQSAHTHLVWGIAPLLCWNAWLRLFTECSNLQRSPDVKNKQTKKLIHEFVTALWHYLFRERFVSWMQTAFGYLKGTDEKQHGVLVNTILTSFSCSSSAKKYSATWNFQAPGLSGDNMQLGLSYSPVYFLPFFQQLILALSREWSLTWDMRCLHLCTGGGFMWLWSFCSFCSPFPHPGIQTACSTENKVCVFRKLVRIAAVR